MYIVKLHLENILVSNSKPYCVLMPFQINWPRTSLYDNCLPTWLAKSGSLAYFDTLQSKRT